MLKIFVLLAAFVCAKAATLDTNTVRDPKIIQCFESAVHHLRPYLATGIPEIELPSVEPFLMDELSLSLTTGPNGYKVSLKEIDIFGASNFTLSKLKLSENDKPFEARINIPLLRINSRYTSSGVLIILPASGNGTFNAQFEDINAIVKGMVSVNEKENLKFLHVDALNLDLNVKNIKMSVKNIYKNNRILTEAINLFLRENGQEVFKVMKPQLRKKLSAVFMSISNKLLTHLPIDQSANYLVANMRRGIPELGLTEPEPIIIDEIGIALGSGPDGYRASFRNIHAYGVSNITVIGVRSDVSSQQFQFTMYIPKISARANYESSGILILVQASGGGEYWGEYEGIKCKVYIRATPHNVGGRTFLALQQIKMDFSVKHIRMGVENVHNGNAVIQAALNLFINTNAQELLKEMKPDLKKKLIALMRNFVENLFANIPYDAWIA
ncbi:JHBP domain containing protein [Asbolus verrucosus]|uniref:JHBP domain containing protein n=1 Tax=Asbolus verrucosus TaxID=1661398 RepID=A0A482W1U5_ASBVE|nr:JHBP domain containing protein [Asbolus verrucosus]